MRIHSILSGTFLSVLLLCACGCASPTAPVNDLWAQEIADAKSEATSDFEKQVFADNKIERDEYLESVQRYVSCLQENGLAEAKATDDDAVGLLSVSLVGGTVQEDKAVVEARVQGATEKCRKGTTELIEPLYAEMYTNPQRLDYNTIMVKCLKAIRAVEDSYTVDQYKKDGGDGSSEANYPFDLTTNADARRCQINPSFYEQQK